MTQLTFSPQDVPDHGMHGFEVDDKKVLVLRDGDEFRAFEGSCPHAGADLSEGVRCAGRVVCPWHHAAFSTDDGSLLEPPADQALKRYTVIRDGDKFVVDLQPLDVKAPPGTDAKGQVVIIGAGAAAFMAIQSLRSGGYDGSISLIDERSDFPYDRTMLSKQFMAGEAEAEDTLLGNDAWVEQQRVERIKGTVNEIDMEGRKVLMASGKVEPFTDLIVATGGKPVTPQLPGAQRLGVYALRSLEDAQALRKAVKGKRLVVVGASFIAMEVASNVAQSDAAASVDLVGTQTEVLGKMVSPAVGKALRGIVERQGVRFHLGAVVTELLGGDAVTGVKLSDGRELEADVVLLGLGVEPASHLLSRYADESGAVPVDAQLRVRPHVFAAGDIAKVAMRTGTARIEHWRVAQQEGMVAAAAILGKSDSMRERVPFFWTQLDGVSLRYVGHAQAPRDTYLWGKPGKAGFIEFTFEHGRAVAAAGLKRDKELAAFEELLRLDKAPTRAQIVAGEFDLAALLVDASGQTRTQA